MKQLSWQFGLGHIKPLSKNLALVFVKEIPCFFITFIATMTGIQFLNHNPKIELVIAITLSLFVEYGYSKYRYIKTEQKAPYRFKLKYWVTGIAIGFVTWGLHQFLLHSHH